MEAVWFFKSHYIALTFFHSFFFQVDKTTMNELELFRLLKEYALALDIETTETTLTWCDVCDEVKTCCSFDSYGAESFCTGENNKLLEVLPVWPHVSRS